MHKPILKKNGFMDGMLYFNQCREGNAETYSWEFDL
jgi:hypothetical protein